MKTNVAACTSIGSYFYPQIGRIYLDMLNMYRASSGLIDDAVKNEGEVFEALRSTAETADISRHRQHCD